MLPFLLTIYSRKVYSWFWNAALIIAIGAIVLGVGRSMQERKRQRDLMQKYVRYSQGESKATVSESKSRPKAKPIPNAAPGVERINLDFTKMGNKIPSFKEIYRKYVEKVNEYRNSKEVKEVQKTFKISKTFASGEYAGVALCNSTLMLNISGKYNDTKEEFYRIQGTKVTPLETISEDSKFYLRDATLLMKPGDKAQIYIPSTAVLPKHLFNVGSNHKEPTSATIYVEVRDVYGQSGTNNMIRTEKRLGITDATFCKKGYVLYFNIFDEGGKKVNDEVLKQIVPASPAGKRTDIEALMQFIALQTYPSGSSSFEYKMKSKDVPSAIAKLLTGKEEGHITLRGNVTV